MPTPEASDAAEPNRGRAARWPWAIPPRGWKDILWRAWNQAGVNRLGVVAGGVTFYLLLAAFPALAAFVSVYGLFMDLGGVEQQLNDLSRVFPRQVVDLIGQEMVHLATQKHADLGTALITGALASVWSANAGMKGVIGGLNVAYERRETRNFIHLNLLSLAFTAGAILFAVVGMAAIAVAPDILLRLHLETLAAVSLLRWPAILVAAALVLSTLYRFGPARHGARWRWITPGGVGAAVAWMAMSLAFSFYVNHFGRYDRTYGPLGAMVGFMTWIWLSLIIVLAGAEFNSELEQEAATPGAVPS